ncbi:MAG: NAD(P)-binding domain-containing protein [Rhodoglobus sp.]
MTLIDRATAAAGDTPSGILPIAIIGAGPIGLATAAYLVERGLDFVVFEAGKSVAANVKDWGHISLFSPWKQVIDPAARRLLRESGWVEPDNLDAAPTGAELIEHYLTPLAALAHISSRIRTGTSVVGVTRQRMDRTRSAERSSTPFVLRIRSASGELSETTARAVIDASGTYRNANGLGANGLDPLGLTSVADQVAPALPDVLGVDRQRFAGKHTTVVGAGHSAVTTVISLAALADSEPGTRVTWMTRRRFAETALATAPSERVGRAALGITITRLIELGAISLTDGSEITELSPIAGRISISGHRNSRAEQHGTDLIVNATGFRPDLSILSEIRLDLDPILEAPRLLAALIDPAVHSCGTVTPHGFAELRQPELDFFIVGMKSYGRAPTFLLATGYEQVRSIVAYLAGDLRAAKKVTLGLPVAGACSMVRSSCC